MLETQLSAFQDRIKSWMSVYSTDETTPVLASVVNPLASLLNRKPQQTREGKHPRRPRLRLRAAVVAGRSRRARSPRGPRPTGRPRAGEGDDPRLPGAPRQPRREGLQREQDGDPLQPRVAGASRARARPRPRAGERPGAGKGAGEGAGEDRQPQEGGRGAG